MAASRTGAGTASSASGTARTSSAVVYSVSATMTLASSRMRVGMINGNTTNSASDGMVKMMLAVTVVSLRSTVVRCTSAPKGTAISSPSSTGINDNRR